MTTTYDTLTDIGKVRRHCCDTDITAALYTDEEITVFLTACDNAVLLAGAMALENVAVNEVLVQKHIKLLDLSTDGPSEAVQLLAAAKRLREIYEYMEAGADFDTAEMVLDPATYAERIYAEELRNP